MESSPAITGNGNCLYTLDRTTGLSKNCVKLKVYKRRLWMLCLFSCVSTMSAIIFPQYVSMANVNICYYGVSKEAVDWTAMIYMIVYLFLVFPVSLLIDYMDLRWTVICTAVCNVIGTAIQFAALNPDSFAFVMVSSFIASLSNVFVLGVPPFLASKWFPGEELSRACAFGVFGNQLGVALGFVMSPLIVSSDCSRKDLIRIGKRNVAYILTAVNILLFILVTFTFQNAPKIAPSLTQAQRKKSDEPHRRIILSMFKNPNFILIFIVYGLIVGTYFALGTNLNNLILRFFPHKETEIGLMGLIFIVAGMIGSVTAGYILDRTHKFKETSLAICMASLATCIVFSGCLFVDELWVQFVTIGAFGFFLTSFLPIGFEYGIEVTYPQPENICACLLNASTMFFGIVITEMMSHILQSEGPISSNASMTVILFLCCIITTFVTKEYKRSKKNAEIKSVTP